MSVLRVSVPIILQRNSEGFWLEFKGDGKEALVNLDLQKGEIVQAAIQGWARESMVAALKSRRRSTGLQDRGGVLVHEGDIIENLNQSGRAVVKWRDDYAGFVIASPKFCTHNLKGIGEWAIVGNVFEHPERL